jgi:hypothetical protein
VLNAKQENIQTLMAVLGIDESQAVHRLDKRVAITHAPGGAAAALARDVVRLLERTVQVVDPELECDVELAVGSTPTTNAGLRLCLAAGDEMTILAEFDAGKERGSSGPVMPLPILTRKIVACYAAGQVLGRTVDGLESYVCRGPFMLRYAHLGLPANDPVKPIFFEDTVLIGAGGIANGFLWALEGLPLTGRMVIVDYKKVRAGNLNRCLLFDQEDERKPKAQVLAGKFGTRDLAVTSHEGLFKDYLRTLPEGKVRRVITTVDSRVARRGVQNKLPAEVLDASTTDISGIVVHSHRQPNSQACLSCIYGHIPAENQQRLHIVESLGLEMSDVRDWPVITPELARKLANLHGLNEAVLMGMSLDTLFKAKCAEGTLVTPAGKQASAPFAFITNLAGVMLALELLRFDLPQQTGGNYLVLSPWRPPHAHLRTTRTRQEGCEFCSKPETHTVLRQVWPELFSGN